ncbi:MAG: family 20 glycosylhydrolase [Clostridia bacterium]|nr:family 20 glycosylhydrolase [Clostridia bacterium]
MTDKNVWAFLIHLGSNMWAKKGTTWGRNIHREDFCYKETMFCDKEVWRKVTDFLPSCGINTLVIDIGEGLVLDSHPEIAVPGAWTKDELRSELERIRALGMTPIPKYNFSCRHNAWMGEWAYKVGQPEYYDFCSDIINEVVDLFDTPELFHLGYEEEIATDEHMINVCRSPKKKIEDANFLYDVLRKRGVRPWVWLDIHAIDTWDEFEKVTPKDIVISTWHYGTIHDTGDITKVHKEAYYMKELDDRGYTQIPTSSTWAWHCNSKDTMNFCKQYCTNGTVIGHMTASWMLTTPSRLYALYNDAYNFYWARKDIYGF